MMESDPGSDPGAAPRVGVMVIHSAGGFEVADGMEVSRIRRRRWFPAPASFASIFSACPPESHDVFTWMVPVGREPVDPSSVTPASSEGLRIRRSTEIGRPLIWNRLTEFGIESIVVGSPFMPGGRPGVEESTARSRTGVLASGVNLSTEEKFDQLAELKSGFPRARFVFLGLKTDVPAKDVVPERMSGQALRELHDRFGREMELDHTLLVGMGPRFEWVTYAGPRDARPPGRLQVGSVVKTILDLFGLPTPADVAATSMLEADRAEDAPIEGTGVRWVLPEEDGGERIDFEPMFQRVRSGEAGRLAKAVSAEILRGRWEQSFEKSRFTDLEAIAADLLLADDTPMSHFRYLISVATEKNRDEFTEARARLRERHPETTVDQLVDLLPMSSLTDEERLEILDRHPINQLRGPHLRGLWARSAVRLGRVDAGLEILWQRIRSNEASWMESSIFTNKAIERNQEGDLKKARITLRGQLEMLQGPERRSKIVRRIAETFRMEGDIATAIQCLERFLARNPGEIGATRMLDGFRRMNRD